MNNHAFFFEQTKRVVVKVGSNVLTRDNRLNLEFIHAISRQISNLMERGMEVLLVSSGSMATGLKKLGLDARPEEIPQRQAVAAVGQAGLIIEYEKAFINYGRKVAQILLTGDGLTNRKRYLNARNTLHTLISWKVVPIINENDTISVEEIKFGDNDNLSAIISLLMDADLLISLSDIDGLYTDDPRTNPDAELIPFVPVIKKEIEKIAGNNPGELGTGGMRAKITAAKKVTTAGIPMVITGGLIPDILLRLFDGEPLGTYFVPKEVRMAHRKRWIGYSTKPDGVLYIDDGAMSALLKNGKSLLPSGIMAVEGDFSEGAAVEFKTRTGHILGTGLVNYSSSEIRMIKGCRTDKIKEVLGQKTYDEVIHRDNLVITADKGY